MIKLSKLFIIESEVGSNSGINSSGYKNDSQLTQPRIGQPNSNEKSVIDQVINAVLSKDIDVQKIILYGSRARNDYTKSSDFDMIAIVSTVPPETITDEVYKELDDLNRLTSDVDIRLLTQDDEWTQYVISSWPTVEVWPSKWKINKPDK